MKIKKILISQPEPADLEKSPYRNLIQKYGVDITFYKFFEVVGLTASEFRRTRIHIGEYSAIIFNSKQSIDHFFRMLKELRETVGEEMKYFCATESIALYLQNYIQYRKRKVFFGAQYFSDLVEIIAKHRDEKYLFPCSDEKQTEYTKALDKAKIKYTKAPMYTSKSRDLTKFNIDDYDAICLFSPVGVRSLVKNFPDIGERNIIIAAFGSSTHSALKEYGLKLGVAAPTQTAPSMAMALENYILGRQQGNIISLKGENKRGRSGASTMASGKRAKPVIANKEIYKQRMEAKKAQAAARRAQRAAERARLAAEQAEQEAKKEVPAAPKKVVAAPKKTDAAPKKVAAAPKKAATASKKSTTTPKKSAAAPAKGAATKSSKPTATKTAQKQNSK